MAVYTLPELPYGYAALEPHISSKTMGLHHDKHHTAYIVGANAALEVLAAAHEAGDLVAINLWGEDLAFNLGGHINYSIFWKNLSPNDGDRPGGELVEAIKDSFSSFEKFQVQFTATTMGIQGSGWTVLAYDPLSGRLVTFQLFDQQDSVPVGIISLFIVDIWERILYLDCLSVKADYVKAVWNIANWQDISERLVDVTAKVQDLIVRWCRPADTRRMGLWLAPLHGVRATALSRVVG